MPTAPLLINLAFVPSRPTGLAVYALNLVPHLADLGGQVLSDRPLPGLPHLPVPSAMTPEAGATGHGRRLLWTQFALPRIYRRAGAGLLFSPIPEAPLWAGCRTVVTAHDLIPLRFPRRRSPLTLYCRHYLPWVLRQAEHVICNSEATRRDIHHFFGPPPGGTTVIPLAYDADHYRVLDLPRQPYFLALGSHYPYKNLHRLIEAVAQLPDPELRLLIAGHPDPRYTPDLEALVRERGLGDSGTERCANRVEFLAYVPDADLPRLINQAIALVQPSLWEGFGLPVLEAMACGTPVIAARSGALPEVAGEAALLVDPLNVAEMAAAMASVASDGGLWQRLRQAGLERARQFSWRATGAQTSALLRRYL